MHGCFLLCSNYNRIIDSLHSVEYFYTFEYLPT